MIKLVFLLFICHAIAYAICRRLRYEPRLTSVFIDSIAVLGVVFITGSALAVISFTFIYFFFRYRKSSSQDSTSSFLGVLLVLTASEALRIHAPGVEYLLDLSYPRALVIAILLPLILRHTPRYFQRTPLDTAAIGFFLIIIALNFRNPSFTHALRLNTYFCIDCVIPFVAFRRHGAANNGLVVVFVFALLSQALVGITESFYGWRLYAEVEKLLGYVDSFNIYRNSRDFGLRVGASLQGPSIFALFTALGILSIYQLTLDYKRTLALTISMFIFAAALLFSGSRGGLLSCLTGATLMYLLNYQKKSKLIFFTPGKMVVIAITLILVKEVAVGLLENYDQYGTISYRMLLLSISSKVIIDSPFVGNENYLLDPRLEVLRQGQGIIDIVNYYLAMVLQYGLVAGALLVFVLAGSITMLLLRLTRLRAQPVPVGVFLVVGWLTATSVMIFTTSMRGILETWLWIAVGLGSRSYQQLEADQPREVVITEVNK